MNANEHCLFLNSSLNTQWSAVLAKLWNSCVLKEISGEVTVADCIFLFFWTQTKSLKFIHLLDLSLKNFGYFQNKTHASSHIKWKIYQLSFVIVYTELIYWAWVDESSFQYSKELLKEVGYTELNHYTELKK